MEYVIGIVVLAVVVYMLTRKKKKKPPIEPPIEKEEQKEVIVKPLPTEQKVYWIKDGKKEWGIAKNMPQGLQVFDEQGNCVLDITDRLTRIIDKITASSELYKIDKTYTIQSGQKIWWSLCSATDYKTIPIGGAILGFLSTDVEIAYQSDTTVKFSVSIPEKGDTVIVGVY